jgi:hypothetical protein
MSKGPRYALDEDSAQRWLRMIREYLEAAGRARENAANHAEAEHWAGFAERTLAAIEQLEGALSELVAMYGRETGRIHSALPPKPRPEK